MRPPRRAQHPNLISTASYWREGKRILRTAWREYPSFHAINSVIEYLKNGGELTPATVLRYRENCRRVIQVWARKFGEVDAWVAVKMADVDTALAKRRIRGRRKKGTKKIPRLASEPEFRAITENLRLRYSTTKDITPAVTFFYAYAMMMTGARPVELVGATVVGNTIKIPNAKRTVGQAEFRFVSLEAFPPRVLIGFGIFLEMISNKNLSRYEFDRFRNRLSEALARACDRVGVPRLSLYSFRHLAIALWTESGVLTEVIAQLAGHFSSLTAIRNYARGTSGRWKPEKRQLAKIPENTNTSLLLDLQNETNPNAEAKHVDPSTVSPAFTYRRDWSRSARSYQVAAANKKTRTDTNSSPAIGAPANATVQTSHEPNATQETEGERIWREWTQKIIPRVPTAIIGQPRGTFSDIHESDRNSDTFNRSDDHPTIPGNRRS